MHEESLPKEYKGYSTQELLDLWLSIPGNSLYDPPTSKKKISAMRDLLLEYRLTEVGRGYYGGGSDPAKLQRIKRLCAPYGVDPYPWADENGVEQEELGKACAERSRRVSAEVQARLKVQREQMGRWAYLDFPEPED